MRYTGRDYRGHDPQWSFAPLSGEGASIAGGRFNRPGEPTLHLSLSIVTAVAECTQGFGHRLQPLTICEYDIDCDPVADLRGETERNALGVSLSDLGCPWLSLALVGHEPPSRLAADRLRDEGHVGALVPSFVPGATATDQNLVLWRWGADLPCRITVHDPAGRLPVDQSSWR